MLKQVRHVFDYAVNDFPCIGVSLSTVLDKYISNNYCNKKLVTDQL